MQNYLSAVDYVVFSVVLAFSGIIGVYYACTGGKQKTAAEFLMANRQMGVLPVSLSLLASFMSAITLLGTPAELYLYGTQYWLIAGSYVLVMVVAGHVLLPVFYNLQLTSAYEYLERRFHRSVRLIASLTVAVQMTVYMGIVLYAPALALNAVTGLSWITSVLVLGAVCTFYTTIGGMKAVMWTDVFQILIMFIGMLAVVIQGLIEMGGFAKVWEIVERGRRVEFLNLDPNPQTRHTVWSLVLGGSVTWLVVYGVNQSQVQRYLTTNTMRKAQIALWLNLPGLWGLMALCGLAGLIAYAYYDGCDPLTSKQIEKSDQILPFFVMDLLSHLPGFPGLFIAAVFSGAMSTVSSGVNSLAAIILEDVVKPYCLCCRRFKEKPLTDEQAGNVSKLLALIFGGLAIALAFLASFMGNVLQAALGLFGMVGGPILGVFLLGILFPWANWKGALCGQILGEALSLWVGFGGYIYKYPVPKAPLSISLCSTNITRDLVLEAPSNFTEADYEGLSIYRLSYMWQGMFAVICTVSIGLIMSFVFGYTKPSEVDPQLLCPIYDTFFCCLPASWRTVFNCGAEHKEKAAKQLTVSTSQVPLKNTSAYNLQQAPDGSFVITYGSKLADFNKSDQQLGVDNLAFVNANSVDEKAIYSF